MKSKTSRRVMPKMEPGPCTRKKLRSKRPRRRRSHISPVICSSLPPKNRGLSAVSVDSSACSYFHADDLSFGSSRVSKNSNTKKRQFSQIEESGASIPRNETLGDLQFRRITRSYYKQQEIERRRNEVEVSESSCVESNSGANFGATSLKLKKPVEIVKGIQRNVNLAVPVTLSSVSCVEQVSGAKNLKISSEDKENDAISITSGVDFCSRSRFGTVIKGSENKAPVELELSEASKPSDIVEAYFAVSNSESAVEQRPKSKSSRFDSDLACTEQFSYDDVSEYSETALSEMQSEILPENSDLDFSDYTPSIFYDSGIEFSEKSYGDSPPSQTYSLFLEFKEQFSRSTTPLDTATPSSLEELYPNQPTLVAFEDEEDEKSYQNFRERERRQVFLRDYAEEYRSTTEYGDLVLQERSRMVHWMVEQCTTKKLHQETMFLGVSLLDRFLSRGFFKTGKNLQIVGIACLALATRLEENQPYNSVRQKNFYIGRNSYSRCEVVAMEWLVQEVLNFQCFLPTIYNFLWFYLKAVRADADVDRKAKYLAVLALSDHEHLSYWPSTVAAGLVILASVENNKDASYENLIEIYVRTKDNDLPECIKRLQWLLQFVS